jgi:hypothetical protein
MATTPKASRRPRGTYASWQPPRTVWGRREYLRVGGDDPLDRWFGKRRCGDRQCLFCPRVARLRRMHQQYARRR